MLQARYLEVRSFYFTFNKRVISQICLFFQACAPLLDYIDSNLETLFDALLTQVFERYVVIFLIWRNWYSEAVAWRCFVEKVFLKIYQNSQEITCVETSFLIKLQAWVCIFLWIMPNF